MPDETEERKLPIVDERQLELFKEWVAVQKDEIGLKAKEFALLLLRSWLPGIFRVQQLRALDFIGSGNRYQSTTRNIPDCDGRDVRPFLRIERGIHSECCSGPLTKGVPSAPGDSGLLPATPRNPVAGR